MKVPTGNHDAARIDGKVARERDIQRDILDYLAQLPGVYAWKAGAGMFRVGGRVVRMGKVGVADIIGWRTVRPSCRMCASAASGGACTCDGNKRARFLAIECKRPGGKLTPEQAAFLERVREAGGLAIVATCVADVRRVLEEGQPC